MEIPMKVNTDPNNLCPTWDLTLDEIEKFYRGAGAVTIVLDEHDNILQCFYHETHDPLDDEAPTLYAKKIFPLAHRQIDGTMSCHQFCRP
jgi:hypothetical protein